MEEKKYLVIDGKQTKIEDLTGYKFGRLMVVKFDEERYKRDKIRKQNGELKEVQTHWFCDCDCGTKNRSVRTAYLRIHNDVSCGCHVSEQRKNSYKDLSGKRFGRLLVLERDMDRKIKQIKKGKNSYTYWLCKCDCGNYTTIVSHSLTNKNGTRSCGCLRLEAIIERNKEYAISVNGSLGDWILKNLPENFIELYWSKNNKLSPFDMPYAGTEKIYIICPECKKEYSLETWSFTLREQTYCIDCNLPKGEREIKKELDNYNIKYEIHKTFDNLVGINGGLLSYDFYLPNHNLLIEYQGQFHDGSNGKYTMENLETQQEHDRRKCEYAKEHNIKLLEIWYWDFDNIEEILTEELKLN